MMKKNRTMLPAALVLAGLALLGMPRDARALLTLKASQTGANYGGSGLDVFAVVDNNTGVTPGTTGFIPGTSIMAFFGSDENGALGQLGLGTVSGPLQVGSFAVTASLSTSTSPTIGLSDLKSSSTDVTNNTGSTATVAVMVSDTGYQLPGSPPLNPLQSVSHVNGQFTNPTASDQISIGHFVDTSNTLFGMSDRIFDTAGDFVFKPETFFGGNTTYQKDSPIVNTNVPSGVYANTISFTLTLGAGAGLHSRGNDIDQQAFTTAVPEPASIAMAASAVLPLLAYGLRRRRRQA